MPLMVSISGIRGVFGDGLDPDVLLRYGSAFGVWCKARADRPTVVVGRDARVTGDLCARLVSAALQSVGCDVVDAGLATTPTVEMAVRKCEAAGAVMLSASHNPEAWNALKLLNHHGEFLSHDEGTAVQRLAESGAATYTVAYDAIGAYRREDFLDYHIEQILDLPYIDPERIRRRGFRVVVDAVDSVGGIAVPALLERLGVDRADIVCMHCEPTGRFSHNPEPLPAHLEGLMARVPAEGADLGIVVDPDVDRIAFVEPDGTFFGEELTQVAAADFLLRTRPGPVATNLSSSRTLEDVARRYGQEVHRSPVGEINVVEKMKAVGAVIGGEGSGGVILPDLHYGRDALAATALVMQHLANTGMTLTELRRDWPVYRIVKHKLPLGDLDPDRLLERLAERVVDGRVDTSDGLKIDLTDGWVHLRKSNTEPILRVYAEAGDEAAANALAERYMEQVRALA